MIARHARTRRSAEGQSLVEFALIAPLLFLVFFAIIQFGFLFGGQNGLVNGVRDTARYASTYRVTDAASATATCAAVQTQLINNLKRELPGFAATRLHPAVSGATSPVSYAWYTNADGTYSVRVVISAKYDHPLFVPIVGNIVDLFDGVRDNSMTLGASEQMRVENPALTSNGGTVTCP